MRTHTRNIGLAMALLWLVTSLASAQPDSTKTGPPPPPAARKIPGVNAADAYPRACVDCHIVMKEFNMDTRLSRHMAQWTQAVEPKLLECARAAAIEPAKLTGKHPQATASLQNIPGACIACHKKDSKTAPPFARLLHAIHLGGGDQSPFMTYFQGECTHCHKLDPTSGRWSIPSAAEE